MINVINRTELETRLRDFDTWSGATDTVNYLTQDELDEVESVIIELYPHGLDSTLLNDILWFETDFIAEILGYDDFDEIMER